MFGYVRFPAGKQAHAPACRRPVLWLGLMAVSVLLGACASSTDLQAVQTYARATADASTSFSSVAADFAQSCLRRREFTLRTIDLPYTIVQLAPAYGAEAVSSPSPSPSPSPSAAPSIGLGTLTDDRCSNAAEVSAEWGKHNTIILGYVQALGALAGVDVQPTFAPPGNALVTAKLITQAQNAAFAKLTQQLTDIALAGRQRRSVRDTLEAVDPSLQTAIAALKNVDDAYGQLLNAEFNDTFNFYNGLIRSEIADSADPTQPQPQRRYAIYAQRQTFNASLLAINDRRASTVMYARVLDGIASTHAQLLQHSRNGARLRDYASILDKNVVPLYQDVEALRKVTK
jgi:hypothetical protein